MAAFRCVVCLTVAVMIAGGAMADETKQKKGKRQAKSPSVTQRYVAKLELTDAQKEQIQAIDKEFAAPAAELQKKRNDVLTQEQKQAQNQARKAAREADSEPAQTRKAVSESVQLSEAQTEQMKEIQKSQQELNAKVLTALKKVLTPEQQEQLPKATRGKKQQNSDDARKGRKNKAAKSEQAE